MSETEKSGAPAGEIEQPSRWHRSKQEQRQIVEETLKAGSSVAVIARRRGVNANRVFCWRKLYRDGRLAGKPTDAQLMPMRISEYSTAATVRHSGTIKIDVGRVQLRVEGSADPTTLQIILEQLQR